MSGGSCHNCKKLVEALEDVCNRIDDTLEILRGESDE